MLDAIFALSIRFFSIRSRLTFRAGFTPVNDFLIIESKSKTAVKILRANSVSVFEDLAYENQSRCTERSLRGGIVIKLSNENNSLSKTTVAFKSPLFPE